MTTPTALKFGRDSNNLNAYAPIPSVTKWNATLSNGNATNCQVPNTALWWMVSFRYQPGSSVWVDVSGNTASLPLGNTLQPTTSELIPASLTVAGGTNISMLTANTSADVSVVMWQCQG